MKVLLAVVLGLSIAPVVCWLRFGRPYCLNQRELLEITFAYGLVAMVWVLAR